MKTAKEIMTPLTPANASAPAKYVEAGLTAIDVLPRLLDTPDYRIGVKEGGKLLGEINANTMLETLASLIPARDDSSIITLECRPEDYSASKLATAVEDADTHMTDLWTTPGQEGLIRVTLRVLRNDPSPVVHSLERYGYDVLESKGKYNSDAETSALRLLELNTILSV